MKTLLLIGSDKPLTKTERATLSSSEFRGDFSNADLEARIPARLSAKKDTTGEMVPHIHFPSKTDAEFFFKKVGNEKVYNAFTTLPHIALLAFDGKAFEFINGQFSFTITVTLGIGEYFGTYSNRLLTFTRTSVQTNKPNLGSKIEFTYPAEANALKLLFPVFLDPIKIELGLDNMNLLYRAFYRPGVEDTDFPLVLPPVIDDKNETSAYFHDQNRAVRSKIATSLKDTFPAITSTLGFAIWKAVESPVYRDFLKEGAFFELKSRQAKDNPLLPFFEDGESVLQLVYPVKKSSNDFINHWRHDFFFSHTGKGNTNADENNYSGINLLGLIKAIESDFRDAIPGVELDIKHAAFADYDAKYWDTVTLSESNEGGKLYYNMIELFSKKLDLPSQELMQSLVLNLAVDGEVYKLKWPLEAFCGYFWKYPFERNSSNVSGWTKFLIELIDQTNDSIPQAKFDKLTESLEKNQAGEYTYDKAYRPEEILTLRLSLPLRAFLRSRYNNILDHNNAKLDHNFILD